MPFFHDPNLRAAVFDRLTSDHWWRKVQASLQTGIATTGGLPFTPRSGASATPRGGRYNPFRLTTPRLGVGSGGLVWGAEQPGPVL